jgi:CHAT domain-containing protein
LKLFFLLVCIVFSFVFTDYSEAQNEDNALLYKKFLEQYNTGDLVKAEVTLHLILESKVPIKDEQLSAIYSNLGAINILLAKYDMALAYSYKAEALVINKQLISKALADIYINRARIYTLQKSFNSAIEYLEKGIRLYTKLKDPDIETLLNLSSAYLNIGIAYYSINDFQIAQKYLELSVKLKIKFNLPDIGLAYLNLAKTYSNTNNKIIAEKFYIKSITSFIQEYNKDYYRLADVYFDYGLYLQSEGKLTESLRAYNNALSICLKNYGEKHTLTSLSYKHVADDYFHLNKPDSALYYYQKSLMAVGKNFTNPDIFTNPAIDSSLFDIRLLDNLKSKAQALELFAGEQNDTGMKLKAMTTSLGTMDLALQLIDTIRNNYMSEESQIYLAENEKETYLFAAHMAYSLYSMTHDKSMGYRMYAIAQEAKAAILRNEIIGNELLYSAGVPDSLRDKQNSLSGNIAAYNNLIIEENRKLKPDSNKISLWKDALFDMNREKERVTDKIEKAFPQFHDLIRKTEPVSLKEIQKKLKKDETIVDYLLSNQYSGGKRKLYVFVITGNSLDFREQLLDSVFVKNAEILRETASPSMANGPQNNNFASYTGALNYMYLNLIKPVEELFKSKKLIIIPDEEIGWLPFDAFLKDIPRSDQTDYEGLHYLINDYTFSYGYSSSLIFNKSNSLMRGASVFAFSPDYRNTALSGKAIASLQGAGVETSSIYKWFGGKNFSGENATKANFMTALHDPAIFHLAMHSVNDSVNSKYSYLMFDKHNLTSEQAKLYNYEISLTRVKSPMVVLSACNSGTGTLFYGEGLMSLARSFTLAGAASVIKTAWEINDEASAAIITQFYLQLSKGKEKNEAMHLAKLDYLKKSSPAFKNPYYWAAYEVLGNNDPVARNTSEFFIIISLVIILSAGIMIFYFKRRRISSDRTR